MTPPVNGPYILYQYRYPQTVNAPQSLFADLLLHGLSCHRRLRVRPEPIPEAACSLAYRAYLVKLNHLAP